MGRRKTQALNVLFPRRVKSGIPVGNRGGGAYIPETEPGKPSTPPGNISARKQSLYDKWAKQAREGK